MGVLITIEGGDFVGKTSLAVPGLHAVLTDCGFSVLTSREPGGSPEGEEMRNQIFELHRQHASQHDLAVLFNKARRIHLEQVIIPFLGRKKEKKGIVILDRYLDSTRVYQGLEGRIPLKKIYQLEDEFVDGFLPDITFVLYFPEAHLKELIQIRKRLSEEDKAKKQQARSHTPWDETSTDEYKRRQEFHWKLQEIAKERGEQREFIYVDASARPFEIIKKMAEDTITFMARYRSIELPQDYSRGMSKALTKAKTSLYMIFQERQWKKQQSMLKSGTML